MDTFRWVSYRCECVFLDTFFVSFPATSMLWRVEKRWLSSMRTFLLLPTLLLNIPIRHGVYWICSRCFCQVEYARAIGQNSAIFFSHLTYEFVNVSFFCGHEFNTCCTNVFWTHRTMTTIITSTTTASINVADAAAIAITCVRIRYDLSDDRERERERKRRGKNILRERMQKGKLACVCVWMCEQGIPSCVSLFYSHHKLLCIYTSIKTEPEYLRKKYTRIEHACTYRTNVNDEEENKRMKEE